MYSSPMLDLLQSPASIGRRISASHSRNPPYCQRQIYRSQEYAYNHDRSHPLQEPMTDNLGEGQSGRTDQAYPRTNKYARKKMDGHRVGALSRGERTELSPLLPMESD